MWTGKLWGVPMNAFGMFTDDCLAIAASHILPWMIANADSPITANDDTMTKLFEPLDSNYMDKEHQRKDVYNSSTLKQGNKTINEGERYVPIAKVEKWPWTACSDGCELAEEKDLNVLPAAVKCHLSSGQQNTCKLGNVFHIHVLLWPPVEL